MATSSSAVSVANGFFLLLLLLLLLLLWCTNQQTEPTQPSRAESPDVASLNPKLLRILRRCGIPPRSPFLATARFFDCSQEPAEQDTAKVLEVQALLGQPAQFLPGLGEVPAWIVTTGSGSYIEGLNTILGTCELYK